MSLLLYQNAHYSTILALHSVTNRCYSHLGKVHCRWKLLSESKGHIHE